MTIGQLFEGIVNIQEFQKQPVNAITCNTSHIKEGSLFVCLKGTHQDGHDFAAIALQKGACIILTEKDLGLHHQIIVPDTRSVYPRICARFFNYPADKLRMAAVTGTNGKTTTTFLLRHIFESGHAKSGLIGTIHNIAGANEFDAHNTTPDAYELQWLLSEMVNDHATFAAIEASSHALEQGRLDGCQFEAAVFTNLTQDHLDYHGTMEHYMQAKRHLFSMSKAAVINIDDPWARKLVEGLPVKTVSFSLQNRNADITATDIFYQPDGSRFTLWIYGVPIQTRINTPGQFSVYNALGAAGAAYSMGFSIPQIAESLASFKGVEGRMEVVPSGNMGFTILIDYAHTPDGLEKVLTAAKQSCKGRLIVVFGCGGDRDTSKRKIMGQVGTKLADYVIITSDNPRTENPSSIIEDILEGVKGCETPYTVIESRRMAIVYAIRIAQPGDVVLLAGKGHEKYQILNSGVIHFDEREVVKDALATIPMKDSDLVQL